MCNSHFSDSVDDVRAMLCLFANLKCIHERMVGLPKEEIISVVLGIIRL